ncbi:adipokinetic hormone/corazonin-related peptide receptor variant I-like isoform X2 [Mytilus trossulus]|uniref:adipokinetic hormone/corazonin-related peptide receptor variant I-like isoform X2 n=1 Tax=Mytilus trossulus TaxID=6551 RepID=UPI003005CC1C
MPDKPTEKVTFYEILLNSSNSTSTSFGNASKLESGDLPTDLTFNDENLMAVVAYSVLFVIAASGNLTVFITLFRNRHLKSRVNLFILHLSLADLIVAFIMVPMEIIWHATVAWKGGDLACRILMFFRTFGLYLSSFILVTISLDRYFAILHPLSLNDANKRGKIMLLLSWIFSFVASIPQSVIFHVDRHPTYTWFTQCVTFNFFPTTSHELAYNLFNLTTLYGLPLIIISVSYCSILYQISKKTRQSKEEALGFATKRRSRLRRSAVGNIEKARSRTLKMTLVIVSVFIMCWTPYYVISAWWWFDIESAKRLNSKIKKGLFLFAVSNSCMDPIVYGMFTINFKREFLRCCCCLSKSWRSRHMAENTRNPQVNSQRTPLKTSLRKSTSTPYVDVESDQSSSNLKSSISDRSSRYRPCTPEPRIVNENRANMNNFLCLNLPLEETKKNMTTTIQ